MRDSLPPRSTTLRWPRRSSPSSRTPRFSNLFREQELRKHWQPAPRRVESSGDSIKKLQPGGAVAQLGARLDGIEEVVGSNPIGSTNFSGSNPDTWVAECTGYIGNSLGPNWLSSGSGRLS